MALVKCPKCGENVSSTAKYCVHCGVAFHGTCFECGGLLLEGETTCRICGANQNATAEERAVPVAAATVATTSMQAVAKEEPADGVSEEEKAKIETEMGSIIQKRKERDKKVNTLRVVLEIFSIGFFVFAFYRVYKKLQSVEYLPSYLMMESAPGIIFMLVISSILDIADKAVQIYTSLNKDKVQTQELEALGKEKWRYYIKQNASKTRDKNEQAAFDNALRIGYLIENPDKKGITKFLTISRIICLCVNMVGAIILPVIIYGTYKFGVALGTSDVGNLFWLKIKDLIVPVLMLPFISLPLVIIGMVFESKIKKEAKLYQESILAEEKELKNE